MIIYQSTINFNPKLSNQEQPKVKTKNLKSSFSREKEREKRRSPKLQCQITIKQGELKWHGATVPLSYLASSRFLGWHGHPAWRGALMPLHLGSKSTLLAPTWRDIR